MPPEMVLITGSINNYEDPVRTLAVVDFNVITYTRDYFKNIQCWICDDGYWGEEWKQHMKVLKRKEV